jgi:hypothetical protein
MALPTLAGPQAGTVNPHPDIHNENPRHAGIPPAGRRQVMRQPPSGVQISAITGAVKAVTPDAVTVRVAAE